MIWLIITQKGPLLYVFTPSLWPKIGLLGRSFPPLTVIHSLSRTLLFDNLETLLCPLCAMKYYLERTRNRRYGKKRLFISDTNQLGDVTKNVLSC